MKKHTFLAVALVGVLSDQGVNGIVEWNKRGLDFNKNLYPGYSQLGAGFTSEEAYFTPIVEAKNLTFKVQKLDERDEAFRPLRAAMAVKWQFRVGLEDEAAYYWIRLNEEKEFIENKKFFVRAGQGETPRLGIWDRDTREVALVEPRVLFLKYFEAYRKNPGVPERRYLRNIAALTLLPSAAEKLAVMDEFVRPAMAFEEGQRFPDRDIEMLFKAITDGKLYERSVAGEIKVDPDKGRVTPIVYGKYSKEAVNIEDKVAKAEKQKS